MIYLDNAATTINKPQVVIDAMTNALKNFGNAGRGANEENLNASRVVYDTRVKIAKFFNFDEPSNVIFTMNSTESLNITLFGLINENDNVITTDWEHNSVLRPLYNLEKIRNVNLKILRSDENGNLNYNDFDKNINEKTKVVVVNHASNLTGNVMDIKYIANLCKKINAILVVDCSQSAGNRKIDMKELGIDVLCFTGHKSLYGPQGIGGMLIRKGIEIRPLLFGGTGVKTYDKDQPNDYPTRLEAGTLNSHGIAGLNAAIDFINEIGVDNIEKKEKELTKYFYNNIKDIEGVEVYGDFSKVNDECFIHSPVVSINIRDYDSGEVADYLFEKYQISTRAGGHCVPLMHETLGTKNRGQVRFSFSYQTTFDELDVAIKAIKEIAREG